MRAVDFWASMFTTGAALSLAFLAVHVKADTSHLPATRQCGDITFISGGIGTEESEAMKREAPKRSLALLSSVRIGTRSAYNADVHVTILDLQNRPTLDVISDGPYFFGGSSGRSICDYRKLGIGIQETDDHDPSW